MSPSGKLPISFPAAEAQTWLTDLPSQYPGTPQPGTAEPRYVATYSEGLEMGYRWFDAHGEAPLAEFGAGLSYSTFAFSGLVAAESAEKIGEIALELSAPCRVAAHDALSLGAQPLGMRQLRLE